jgi:hypothetical protein
MATHSRGQHSGAIIQRRQVSKYPGPGQRVPLPLCKHLVWLIEENGTLMPNT